MPEHSPAGRTATYVPARADPPEMTTAAARSLDWFAAAAIGTWAACGLWPAAEIVGGRFSGPPAVLAVLMFTVYGAALLAILRLPRRAVPPFRVPLALALLQTVIGIGINAVTARYLHGTGIGLGLPVIVAAELPYFLSLRWTWTWIALQTVGLTLAIGAAGSPFDLEMTAFATTTVGFQVFAAACSILALSEGRARTSLARTNAELTATRGLLAESIRSSERLRISRDLHDTLGHHLTALSLQLDIAARLSEGKAADHVRHAHAITRLLLGDVRNVVGTLRGKSRVDLAESIHTLAVQPLAARVHVDLPVELAVDGAERAEAILRAVQEALTNAARHAHAANVWLCLEQSDDGTTLHVRDDGRGAGEVTWGNGLRGMKERFVHFGGRVAVRTAPGQGFELRAFMPGRSPT